MPVTELSSICQVLYFGALVFLLKKEIIIKIILGFLNCEVWLGGAVPPSNLSICGTEAGSLLEAEGQPAPCGEPGRAGRTLCCGMSQGKKEKRVFLGGFFDDKMYKRRSIGFFEMRSLI